MILRYGALVLKPSTNGFIGQNCNVYSKIKDIVIVYEVEFILETPNSAAKFRKFVNSLSFYEEFIKFDSFSNKIIGE